MDKIELIDRAAVIDAITSFCRADNDCKEFEGEACRGCEYYFCVREISKIPTIDAAPVRRSEWVTDDDNTDDWAEPYCKKCGCFIPLGPANFCPNCGADMRGETHGTD